MGYETSLVGCSLPTEESKKTTVIYYFLYEFYGPKFIENRHNQLYLRAL